LQIISASRRTDLISFFFDSFYNSLKNEQAIVLGPYGKSYTVNLSPENVHTIVLWSKNFENIIKNRNNILKLLKKYKQTYLLFTITGLGGSSIERIIPSPDKTLSQIKPLTELFGSERVAIRFDPILFYKENNIFKTNFPFFEKLINSIDKTDIKKVIFSFTQYYGKVKKRFDYAEIEPINHSSEEKLKYANKMVNIVKGTKIKLFSCSQDFLLAVNGINKSRCIDAEYLSKIHPLKWKMEYKKDKGQREECGCSISKDIGSYSQLCPIPCLYCYANNKIKIDIKKHINRYSY
jgi:hypothetical protein